MGEKKLNIVIKRGLGIQGPGPDFPHLESPDGEVHTVDAAFGWQLVAEERATPAHPVEDDPRFAGRVNQPDDGPGRRRR